METTMADLRILASQAKAAHEARVAEKLAKLPRRERPDRSKFKQGVEHLRLEVIPSGPRTHSREEEISRRQLGDIRRLRQRKGLAFPGWRKASHPWPGVLPVRVPGGAKRHRY